MPMITTATNAIQPQATLRFGSVPAPLWALSAAERAIAAPRRAAERRNRALAPVLRRPPARNAVAADRLLRAVATALGEDPMPDHLASDRHAALECTAFTPDTPWSHAPAEPAGLSLRRLVVLAGKRLDWRFTSTVLHVTHHAAVRFAERSWRIAPEDLTAAATEAAGVADAVLLGHLDGPLAERLANGSAAMLLPAGPGAFLGFLRLLETVAGETEAVIEASTWVHEVDLGVGQLEALAFCRAGLPVTEMLRHMPEGFAGVRASVTGDRRVAAGLRVVPLRRGDAAEDWLASLAAPAAAGARLRLGLACPDIIAGERRRLRRDRGHG
jgi:hypothetical protein